MSKNMIFGFLYSRAGGVAQMIECLLSKCEALRSNPSTAKKKKERKKMETMLFAGKWMELEIIMFWQYWGLNSRSHVC
jgi:hypothetical protein